MSGRKQEYVKLDENFLPRLNDELREVWLKLNQLDQGKPHLAGPNRVPGLGRRMALVSHRLTLPADGGATVLQTARVPLNGNTCLDGHPQFQKVDWVGGVSVQIIGATMSGNYNSHGIEMAKMDEEAVWWDVFRDFTGGTVPVWDVVMRFAVSGTVARV